MSKSDIVFNLQYRTPKNKKVGITKWIGYASQKSKADSTSIDNYDILNDYNMYTTNQDNDVFLWNSEGNLSKTKAKEKINDMNEKGVFWRGFLSFPPDFAIKHGLISKTDYFNLTNNVIPSLIVDMGLDINNTEWMCSLHRDVFHPHIHFCIYEKNAKKKNPRYEKAVIHKFKSNVGNYLIDNTKFYKLRDKSFSKIVGNINYNELNKLKTKSLFSDDYRKGLNKLLLNLYEQLPKKGRLQYNSKNMIVYKKDLDAIIEYILLHDSTKYEYAKYLRLLEEHQKELNTLYGMSKDNMNNKYYNQQLNKLYSKIGNEILLNFKRYSTADIMENEIKFLKRNIKNLKFKSRNYVKNETIINIGKELYKICKLCGLSDVETKKVIAKWISNSKFGLEINDVMMRITTLDNEMSSTELYNALKKLGYSYERYRNLKNKEFYKDLNYKIMINRSMKHLAYELEKEEKEIINQINYELENKENFM